ncbi:hypothetical protein QCA50_013066 [Cerrena zonata]|uniref:Uncharacterized protein n=1 Tax=Cerrena zonata TaxID=2478898 RepID=A0AAW0FXR8_9APHY
MLDNWEVREDAERVWDQVKEVRPKDKPQENLFDIDGLAMKLASACDGSYRYNSVKQHVADGLRAAYKVFTCKTITELDQKGYIPKRRASDYDNTIYSRTVPNFDWEHWYTSFFGCLISTCRKLLKQSDLISLHKVQVDESFDSTHKI